MCESYLSAITSVDVLVYDPRCTYSDFRPLGCESVSELVSLVGPPVQLQTPAKPNRDTLGPGRCW